VPEHEPQGPPTPGTGGEKPEVGATQPETRIGATEFVPTATLTVPEHILNSPAVITTILAKNFLTPRQQSELESQAPEWLGNRYRRDQRLEQQIVTCLHESNQNERNQLLNKLRPFVQEVLQDPDTVLKVCYEYESWYSGRLKEYLSIMQGVFGSLEQIPKIDLEALRLKEQQFNMSISEWLLRGDVDDICKTFGITKTFLLERRAELAKNWETQNALDSVDKRVKKRDAYGQPTRENITRRIINALEREAGAWRMEQGFLPWGEKDTRTTTVEQTLERVEADRLELRSLLDARLQWRAQEQLNRIRPRLEASTRTLEAETEETYELFGTSDSAGIFEAANIQKGLESILRVNAPDPNPKAPQVPNALPADHDAYLSEAKANLERLDEGEELLNRNRPAVALRHKLNMREITDEQYQRFTTQVGEETQVTDEGWLYMMLEDQRKDHQDTIDTLVELRTLWDESLASQDYETLQLLKNIIPEQIRDEVLDVAGRFKQDPENATAEDHERVYETVYVAPTIRQALAVARQMSQQLPALEKTVQVPLPGEDRDRMWGEVERRLNSVVSLLLPRGQPCQYLKHPIFELKPIKEGLTNQIDRVRTLCQDSKLFTKDDAQRISEAQWIVQRLHDCHKQLAHIRIEELSSSEYNKKVGTMQTPGCYHIEDGVIYLNRSKVNAAVQGLRPPGKILALREKTIAHEHGHAILDILTRRTSLLNGVLLSVHAQLKDNVVDQSDQIRTFQEVLESQAKDWMIKVKPDDKNFHNYLIDELLCKYSSWVSSGKPQHSSPDTQLLLEAVDRNLSSSPVVSTTDFLQQSALQTALHSTDEYEEGDEEETPPTPTPTPSGGAAEPVADINQDIRDSRATLHKLNEFFKAYPQTRKMTVPPHPDINPNGGTAEEEYELMVHFLREKIEEKLKTEGPTPEMKENASVLKERLDKWAKWINDMNTKAMQNVYRAERTGKEGFFKDIEWVSLKNIWSMTMSIGEDWMRMWKRRGEQVEAKLGKFVTARIPKRIWYVGRLHNEFHRREQASELEEVNHWRESFKNIDSYKLQARLGDPRVLLLDEIKAIFEELAERGRVDWNDEKMWVKLNKNSHYSMLIEPCKNDDLLRDRWLNKLISDIWTDKDLFYKWRRANDSGIKSGKENFTAKVDQLSNVKGGLDGELADQLSMFLETKESGRPIPEDVNPHLYEEVIDYAIRLGRMTMEDKFYFLIRGVASGLLSIDRLRVLAGEGGGYLNIFPFIDYFYMKNNDMAFIKKLDRRLREPGKPYKPGWRTTMFIRVEIAREKRVKERLRKGQSKVGEKMDHDDMPYFLPEYDWTYLRDWYGTAGGMRQKLTPEALKNGYIGFSMKFLTFASLATIEDGKLISDADIADIVSTIGSYIFSDNVLTRNGCDDDMRRPMVSQADLVGTKAVYGDEGTNIDMYRHGLNKFTEAITGLLPEGEWDSISAELHIAEDSDKKVTHERFTSQDEWGKHRYDKELSQHIYNAVPLFLDRLLKYAKTPNGRQELIRKLVDHAGRTTAQDGLLGDALVKKDASIYEMRDAYLATLAA